MAPCLCRALGARWSHGSRDGPTLITSVQRAFRLLEAVSAHENGAPAKQLARETGLPLATAYHLLRTLVHDGYVRKLDDGGFVLGDKLQTLQTHGPRAGAAQPGPSHARRAAGRTAAAAYLTFYEDGEIRVAEIVDGPGRPGSTCGWGSRTPGTPPRWASPCCASWTTSPAATTSPGTPSPISPRGPSPAGRNCCADLDSSPAAPAVTDLEEYALGTVCVAVPVYSGDTLGSLGVSLPAGPAVPARGVRDAADPDREPGDQGPFAHYLKSRPCGIRHEPSFLDETDISGVRCSHR